MQLNIIRNIKKSIGNLKTNQMKLSQNGYEFISQEEGVKTHAYQDAIGIWTVGIGFIQVDGTKVTKDTTLSLDSIKTEFFKQIVKYEDTVNNYVTSKINQNQFDALVSFSFNLGVGALPSSHLLIKINANPQDSTITDEFVKWDKAGGKVNQSILGRRKREAKLYFS